MHQVVPFARTLEWSHGVWERGVDKRIYIYIYIYIHIYIYIYIYITLGPHCVGWPALRLHQVTTGTGVYVSR